MTSEDRPPAGGRDVQDPTDRIAALEGRVRDLEVQIDLLRGGALAETGRLPIARPVPAAPPIEAARPNQPAPPLGAGWAAYAPGARETRRAPATQVPASPPWPTSQPGAPGGTGARPGDPQAPVGWTTPTTGQVPATRTWSFADLEEQLTGRVLAWVGGAAVVLGAILFLSLAFSRGWIGPPGRVAIAFLAGIVLFGIGAWLLERGRQAVVATALVGVGLGVGTLGLVGATRLYGLVPVELGMVGSLVLSIAAAVIAIRASSQTIAAFGLLAVLGAPPLQGAGPSVVSVALLTTALVGTTVIALHRAWHRIPALAFVVAVPQLASWVVAADVPTLPALVVLGAFWAINAIAAGGEELVRPTDRLATTAATLLLADAAFTVWAGFVLLDGVLEPWRGTFLIALAAGHGVLAAGSIGRRGDRNPFGLLAAGTGLAAVTMAVPAQFGGPTAQFGGPTVPLAWSAEAVALAWLADRRRHIPAAAGAVVLAGLALAHVAWVEYPISQFGDWRPVDTPFLGPSGLTLGYVLGAIVVAGLVVPRPLVRLGLAAGAVLLVAYALPYELSGLVLLAGWTAVAVGSVALDRIARGMWPRDVPLPRMEFLPENGFPGWLGLTALIPASLALIQALAVELPVGDLGRIALPAVPFADERAAAAAILMAGCLGAGLLAGGRPAIRVAIVAAGIVAVYALPFEVSAAWTVVGWSALVALGVALAMLDDGAAALAAGFAIGILALAAGVVLAIVAPPTRLVVEGHASGEPLASYVALGALVVAISVCSRVRLAELEPWLAGIGGALAVYLLSVVLVDLFRSEIGRGVATEELAKQAQVVLSVSWTFVGAATLAIALARRMGPARVFGLGLLGLATAKVFVFDLASLDVAYRVLSLVGLGLLLLASAYLYQRLRPAGRPGLTRVGVRGGPPTDPV
jgi:uncharacterized membrane protein